MSEQQVDWKKKYRSLSQDMETLEKKSADVEKELRLLANYLSVALEGETPQLDSSIKTLKLILQEPCGDNLPFLSKLCRQVEDQVHDRESAKSKQITQTIAALLKWIRRLRSQVNSNGSQNILDSLEQRSNNLEDKFFELPSVLGELIELQGHIELGTPSSNSNDEKEFSLDAAVPTSADDEEIGFLMNRVGAELLELISSLHVPKAEAPAARDLVKEIESGFELTKLPEVLQNVVALVVNSNSNTSEDFENYLLELSDRLVEVQTFVEHSREVQQESGKNQKELDMHVRREVVQLHKTVKETHDIGILKKAVSHQLSGLVQAMDDFKKKEEEREERLQGRYENLIGKVEQMEMETLKVKAHMEEERLRARTDPLTGLPNRAAYDEQIAQEYERWSRYKTDFSVAVCDLDFFKKVNDTYGHLAGDKVLRLVGKVISKNIRATDFACRFGGEEFVVMLPSSSVSDAVEAMDKVRQKLETSPFNFHGEPVNITMSFGVTEIKEGDSVDDLFARADQALYQAKENGRNRVCSL
ncbi:MAG: GGDEF domain-containing protein [Neptuniibacter sp.]